MKTELRLANHTVLPGAKVFEIWYEGEFIGQVCGADGPGVRVISKHAMISDVCQGSSYPGVAEVKILPGTVPSLPWLEGMKDLS